MWPVKLQYRTFNTIIYTKKKYNQLPNLYKLVINSFCLKAATDVDKTINSSRLFHALTALQLNLFSSKFVVQRGLISLNLCPLVAGLFTKVNNSMAVADTRIVGGGS
jgi:hypothetical protein